MPTPSATPTAPRGHQWCLQFDRQVCRNCGDITDIGDDEGTCRRAAKIRPIAGFRQLVKPDFRQHFKPDLSAHPKLKKAWDQWQADKGRA